MTRTTCVGITVQDRIYSLPTLPESGEKYQANHYLEIGGDSAATAAVAIAKLGVEVDFIGRIGDDDCGNTLPTELESWGVNTAFHHRYPNARSSQSAILVDQHGERIIVNYPSPDLGTDAEWLEAVDFSHYGLILTGVRWHSSTGKAFSLTRLAGVTVLLDANMTPRDISPLVVLTDHAVFSTPELKHMTGLQSPEEGLFQAAIQIAGKMYVTLGSEGSLWIGDGHLRQQEAFSVNVAGTTGAGDVFHGILAVALTERIPTKETIHFASAVTAMKCTQPGGRVGIPNREQTESFLSLYAQNGKHLPRRGKGVFTSVIEVIDNPRHDQLVHLIAGRGYMNIEELAQLLDISAQAMRRGIQRFSEQGLITRHHGEAGRASNVMNTTFEQRELSLTAEKRTIAEAVVDYLPECCTISITVGTTIGAATGVLLNRRDLRIITNSLRVVQILYKNQDIEVMVPGGTLRTHNGGIIGPGAVDFIEGFYADYLITSIGAIEHDDILLEFDVNEMLVTGAMIEHARSTLLVADHMKFAASTAVSTGNARDVRAFFTDALPPNSFCQLLSKESVELVATKQEVS